MWAHAQHGTVCVVGANGIQRVVLSMFYIPDSTFCVLYTCVYSTQHNTVWYQLKNKKTHYMLY